MVSAIEVAEVLPRSTLCEKLGISAPTDPWFSFKTESLTSMSESTYQSKILSPLSMNKETYCLDTHNTNKSAKYLNVSPVRGEFICFDPLQDCTMGCGPAVLEVKSRWTCSKEVIDATHSFSNLSIGEKAAATDVEAKAPIPLTVDWSVPAHENTTELTSATAASAVPSGATTINASECASDWMDACQEGLSKRQVRLITSVEIDLIQQSLERILEHSQFRAYLSKFIVIASTGHASFCFFYTQSFDSRIPGGQFKNLRIMLITNEDVDTIWCGMLQQIGLIGKRYFLTDHAPLIFRTLAKLCPAYDLHSIRVHVASVSRSTVYFITLPEKTGSVYKVSTVKKSQNQFAFAFKVVMDNDRFGEEVSILNEIAQQWLEDGLGYQFYYRANFSALRNTIEFAPGQIISVPTVANKAQCGYNWVDVPYEYSTSGGVIIMRQGSRAKLQEEIEANNDKVYSDLLECLTRVHKLGFHHRDIRPANCLRFDEMWQLIDFDLAAKSSSDGTSSALLCCQDDQYQRAGFNIQQNFLLETSTAVEWTFRDDLEMLHKACCLR